MLRTTSLSSGRISYSLSLGMKVSCLLVWLCIKLNQTLTNLKVNMEGTVHLMDANFEHCLVLKKLREAHIY
jgi:hypothetical protein